MFTTRKVLAVLMSITLFMSMFALPVFAADQYESESNNTVATADVTYNDYNNYGNISSSSDVDWWRISFSQNGSANFWIGNIPSGCRYGLYLYESDGSLLIAKSTISGDQQLVNARVYAGVTYMVKIKSEAGYSSSNYCFRAKNYTATRNANVYTFTDINGAINFRENFTTLSPHLYSMNYISKHRFDYTAATAYSEIPDCSLVAITNHADAGRINFYDSYLTANTIVYGNANNAGLGKYGYEALSNVKLLTFVGCNSGDTSSLYGNLVDSAINKGVMCSIGWTESFYHDDIILWHDVFYETLSYGYTVAYAISEANSYMQDHAIDYSSIAAQYYGTSPIHSLTLS